MSPISDRDPGDETSADDASVYAWRYERALRLGYPDDQADELARGSTDLHEVEKLLKAGCKHDLAARIA